MLKQRGIDLPIYWGNRNWKPYVADAVRQMRSDGVRNARSSSPPARRASYSSCRQYREDLEQAQRVSGDGAPALVKLRHFFDHPGFVEANVDGLRAGLAQLPADRRPRRRPGWSSPPTRSRRR